VKNSRLSTIRLGRTTSRNW